MKTRFSLLAAVCLLASAQEFRPYPGSKPDEKANKLTSPSGMRLEVYTTSDSFDKVYASYKGLYQEQARTPPAPSLPSGKKVQWSFFVLDGAKDLAHSKLWLKIQNPYIGTLSEDGQLDFKDIRDVRVIQVIRKH